ncbi:hypothetical protein H4Q26_014136 [Puccinia striiformis f. sp. tritici PST-130]|nr:hypothetical protein H4Q26_014136 [Puccinia striiformis f. sp. tritici PST-130]
MEFGKTGSLNHIDFTPHYQLTTYSTMPPKKTVQSTPSRTPIGTKKAVQSAFFSMFSRLLPTVCDTNHLESFFGAENGRTVDVGINSSTSELINPPAKKARKEPAQDTGQDKDEQYGDFEGATTVPMRSLMQGTTAMMKMTVKKRRSKGGVAQTTPPRRTSKCAILGSKSPRIL